MPTMSEIEYRAVRKIELRDASEGQPLELLGYASTFDAPYEVDGMTETIARGAFARTLREKPDVFAFIGHDPNRVIARTTNGSLALAQDDHGLQVILRPIDTQDGRDAATLVRTGTIDSMSFGFLVKDDAIELRNGRMHREIREVELHEVSIVAFPANGNARISTRARERADQLMREQRKASRRVFLPPFPIADMRNSNGNH
jgi:HK97 family phage prohead protease